MRTTYFLILVLGVVAGRDARAELCRFVEGPQASFEIYDRVAAFTRSLYCPADVGGTWQVEFSGRQGKTRVPLRVEKGKIRALPAKVGHELVGIRTIRAKIFPSVYCGKDSPRGKRGVLKGLPGQERVHYPIHVEAKLTGTEGLAGLSAIEETEAYCLKCSDYKAGRFVMKKGRAHASAIEKGVRYEAKISKEWYACVKKGATLEVRYFLGNSKGEIDRAIRPFYIHRGLEKLFKERKGEIILDAPVPVAKLCEANQNHVTWDLWGKGELKRLSGGRWVQKMRCRKK